LVITFRGGEGEGLIGDDGKCTLLGRVLRAIGYFMSRRADELVFVSAHMQHYFPQRRFHVIPSGLDFAELPLIPLDEARRQLGLSPSKPLVLFIGNPEDRWKRYGLARDVFSRVDKSLDAEFIHAWGVPHHRIPVYMNACDVLLFTSIYEGSPNVIKEALACNLPIVSVPVGDVPVRLRGVEGCFVCPDSDPAGIATVLSSVLRKRQRTDGRNAVRELDENLLAGRMIDIYRQAMTKDHPLPNRNAGPQLVDK
jgi:glycosyltransferase involved in cell wall biosynthesis